MFIKNRKTSLSFFPFRVRTSICEIDAWLDYKVDCFFKRPHFGRYLYSYAQSPERLGAMRGLLEEELSKTKIQDYKVLEVGSWCGRSATLWGSICKEFGKGKVFCVDTWAGSKSTPIMAILGNKAEKLFRYNCDMSGVKDYIIPLRGSSNEVAGVLRDAFDFIYIDGDHSYTQFKKDLDNYSKLCKIGGIFCGDDLNILPTREDLYELSEAHKEESYIREPKTQEVFHPGVLLGIRDFFGKDGVSMKDGFWAVRKLNNGWEKISH